MTFLLVLLLLVVMLGSGAALLLLAFRYHGQVLTSTNFMTYVLIFTLAVGFLLLANVQLRSVDELIDKVTGEEQAVT